MNRFSFITLKVFFARRSAKTRSLSSSRSSTTSLTPTLTLAPEPIAIPTFALFKARISFIPSPTITTFALFCSSFISRAFCSGFSSPWLSSIPSSLATLLATICLSPLSISTFNPICFSSFMLAFAPSLSSSSRKKRATSLLSCIK